MKNGLGREMYYMKPLKSPTHIHFLTKNFYGFKAVFCIMILGFPPCFICVLCRAKILPHIYTRIIASLKPPPHIYAHYIREKFRPQIYIRIAVRLKSVGDWLSVGILAFVCITFCICGHSSDKVVFLIGRCQNSIVKVWLDCINSL